MQIFLKTDNKLLKVSTFYWERDANLKLGYNLLFVDDNDKIRSYIGFTQPEIIKVFSGLCEKLSWACQHSTAGFVIDDSKLYKFARGEVDSTCL